MKKTFKYFGLIALSFSFGAFMAVGGQSLQLGSSKVNCWYEAIPVNGGGMYRCGDCEWLENRVPSIIWLYGECAFTPVIE